MNSILKCNHENYNKIINFIAEKNIYQRDPTFDITSNGVKLDIKNFDIDPFNTFYYSINTSNHIQLVFGLDFMDSNLSIFGPWLNDLSKKNLHSTISLIESFAKSLPEYKNVTRINTTINDKFIELLDVMMLNNQYILNKSQSEYLLESKKSDTIPIPSKNVSVKLLSKSDTDLHQKAVQIHLEHFPNGEYNTKTWSSKFNDKDNFLFLASIDNIPAGYAIIQVQDQQLYLYYIGTTESMQRKGVASHLLYHVQQYFKSSTNHTIHLNVKESKAHALQLYQRYGFKVVGRMLELEKQIK